MNQVKQSSSLLSCTGIYINTYQGAAVRLSFQSGNIKRFNVATDHLYALTNGVTPTYSSSDSLALSSSFLTLSHLYVHRRGPLGFERTFFNSQLAIPLLHKMSTFINNHLVYPGFDIITFRQNFVVFSNLQINKDLFTISTRSGLE